MNQKIMIIDILFECLYKLIVEYLLLNMSIIMHILNSND
nr:MAG TPA: hypothetical protein [Caudoviricetes sp.]